MIRILFIILSVCCTVLCSFVAYLSNQAVDDQQKTPAIPSSVSCDDILDSRPRKPDHQFLTDFEPGKYFASRDFNEDGQWEMVSVPFFPDHWHRLDNSYPAVIICFDKIHNKKDLKKVVDQEKIEFRYWPNKQQLPDDIHSRLAKKYSSMDFKKSIVLHSGFDEPIPLLGSSSFVTSVGLGAISMVIGLWNLVLLMFDRRKDSPETNQPVTNRAGLPPVAHEEEIEEVEPTPENLERAKLEAMTFDVFSSHASSNTENV